MSLTVTPDTNQLCLDNNADNYPSDGYVSPVPIYGPNGYIQGGATTATTTLTKEDSGSTVFLPQATVNTTYNLPAKKAGLKFDFKVVATADGTHTQTIVCPDGPIISGTKLSLVTGTTTLANVASQTNIILSATAANVKVGDTCSLECNGTVWTVSLISTGTASGWSTS